MSPKETYPLVSIVISVYNGEAYLAQQLDSIFAQTYPNIEVIAQDDRSSDNSLSILLNYAFRYPNMQVIENPVNQGYIKNFETGMSKASGKFIAPCDQDDVWLPEKITLMVEAIGNYPALYSDSFLVNDQLQPLRKPQLSKLKNLNTYNSCLVFATDNCVVGHAMLLTRTFFEKTLPFHTIIPHDWWFAYVTTFYGGIKYIDKPLVKYRNHPANVIGALKTGSSKVTLVERIQRKKEENKKIINRLSIFYDKCPGSFSEEKKVIAQLLETYRDRTFLNNCKRVKLFFKYRNQFLAIKKKAEWYKYFFCLKMFFKIR